MNIFTLSDIKHLFQEYRSLIIGEVHGVKENILLYQGIIKECINEQIPITIAFEWLTDDNEIIALRKYISEGIIPQKLPAFFLDSDSRCTIEHIHLLKWIREVVRENSALVDIHCFDSTLSDYEKGMANSLIDYAENHLERKILIIAGNAHARKIKNITQYGHLTFPMYLEKEFLVYTIFIKYSQGSLIIDGVDIDITQLSSQQEDLSNYFDGITYIPVATPANQIKDLTMALNLLK
jgi:hypothetical protein